MNLRATGFAFALPFLLAYAPATSSAAPGPDFHYSRALIAPSKVEIRGFNGRIHAEPASGGTLEVDAVKVARRGDPALIRVVAFQHPGGVVVCVLYPGQDANGCRPGQSAGEFHHDATLDVSTEFTVRVPAGVSFDASSVSGDIEAIRLSGDVRLNAVSGSVRAVTTGAASAKTVSGSIDISMGAPTAAASFESVSGSIDLRLPAATNADVDATTVSGQVLSDFFPVTRGWPLPGPTHGRIGAGGPKLLLHTVSGAISLHKI